MFSEDEEYRGGIIYKIFSEWFCPELNNVTNKVLKVIICSTNNAPILLDYSSPDSIDTISKLIIIILDDGFVMGIYNETNGESNFLSFSPSLFDFRQYLNLKNLKKNLERDQLDFLNIILQLLIEKIFDKSKKIMFDRLCKFKEESTVLLETFEKLEKNIKGKFLKIENINDEIEEDLMNSITNIKKIKTEIFNKINFLDINDYYLFSSKRINESQFHNYYDILKPHKELLLYFDFYTGRDRKGYTTYNFTFVDFYSKLIPYFESHFSETYQLTELYISQLSIIISLFERLENGLSSREYKLLKSEIQESGIFLNVFETLNLEKLENINLSIEKLTNLTEILGLKMINQLSEINLTLNQINENISQLRIETTDNLQKINYNLQINNLYSLIGLFQNKRMNRTLTNINNSSN